MPNELGKLEKPAAEDFVASRKLYLVPLVYTSEDPPAEYVEMVERYWAGVAEHLHRLETKAGKIEKVYHESVALSGEEGIQMVEKLNPRSYEIVKQKCNLGAQFEALEDRELAEESMDWQRCLLIGLISRKVAEKIWEFYREATQKRYEHMARRIDESLGRGQAGLLLIQEDHRVQFQQDIQVFYVAPPALDEIRRWWRDRERQKKSS
jgi:hypothetical protein